MYTNEFICETATVTEINNKLKGKFCRLSFKQREYCCRIIVVREMSVPYKPFLTKKDNYYISYTTIISEYNQSCKTVPIFDMRTASLDEDCDSHLILTVCDIISQGLVMSIGIVVNTIGDLDSIILDELSVDTLLS